MIQIDKEDAPEVLRTKGERFQTAAANYWNDPTNHKSDFKPKFEKFAGELDEEGHPNGFDSKLFSLYSYYSDPSVKLELLKAHHGKCAFCEAFILDIDVGDVEHYRPKSAVSYSTGGGETAESQHSGYFWLSQTWENLFLACKQCNQIHKSTRFDVEADGERLSPGERPPGGEKALLLYPGKGDINPREVLRFNPRTAKAVLSSEHLADVQVSQCVQKTIEIVGLNRPALVQARAAHLVWLRSLFILAAGEGYHERGSTRSWRELKYHKDGVAKDAHEALCNATAPEAEFSALAMDALDEWYKELDFTSSSPIATTTVEKTQVFINTNLNLGLREQLDLLEASRNELRNTLEAAAEPDISELDDDYNEALRKYKSLTGKVEKAETKLLEKRDLRIHLEKRRRDLTLRVKQYDSQKVDFENKAMNLWVLESALKASERIAGLKEEQRDSAMGALEPMIAQRIKDDKLLEEENRARFDKDKISAERVEASGRAQVAGKLLQQEQKSIERKDDALQGRIDAVDKYIESLHDPLQELIANVSDIITGYENCGCRLPDRVNRAKRLETSIKNMSTFVEKGKAVGDVQKHLLQKDWPPRITKPK
jgi:hypothetical protein